MQPESLSDNSQIYRFLEESGVFNVEPYGFSSTMQSDFCNNSSNYANIINNLSDDSNPNHQGTSVVLESCVVTHEMSPQDRALAALKNHKEVEKRRRERINSHLNKLRTLLPCNSKTDKASLLAKVVQRVRELKHETSQIQGLESFPSESDEITVFSSNNDQFDGHHQLIFKASLCCEDRSDLLPELIEILKSLNLKTLRAEIATLGGRMRNVFVIAADKDHSFESVQFLQNALKSLLERSSNSTERSKRRRVLDRKLIIQ